MSATAMTEIRLSWDDMKVLRGDLALRQYLQSMGLDTKTMACRRDDKSRQLIFTGAALEKSPENS
jgi:hypothetical protein